MGAIWGVKYYKGDGDTGTDVGSLWTSDGTLLASATFSDETSTGWQTVLFSDPVSITAGTTYVVSYHSNGHYASTSNYFTTDYTNGPLAAFADNNGVYTYGDLNQFPSLSFNATNYWVDVLFNASPVANDDAATVAEGGVVTTVDVLGNDSDLESTLTAASITVFSQGANGTVVYNNDGTFTYTHDGSETTSDSFTYTIDDGAGGTSAATVNLTVTPVNDAPVANDDAATVAEGGAVTTANVLGNDSDLESTLTAASITVFSQGANGTVVYNNDGTFTYTHDGSETTSDSFTYTIDDGAGGTSAATVNLTVNPVNDAPVANDDAATVAEGGAVTTIDVLGNDSDVDSTLSAASITVFSQGANGTVVYNNDGTFTYTHDGSETTSDSFTYTIDDGAGGTSAATVNLTVNPVNDAPVANDDAATVAEGDAVTTIDVLGNDSDVDSTLSAASITVFSQGANGTVVYNNDGTFTYTHDGSETTSDSFTYTIDDGAGGTSAATVNLTVNPVNDAPVANDDAATVAEGDAVTTIDVLGNDSDVDSTLSAASITVFSQGANGTVVYNNDGTFTYTHDGSETTSDSFTYTIDDGAGGTSAATVNLTVNPVNDAPVANDDAAAVAEGDAVTTANVLGNDSDVDSTLSAASITVFSQGANGTVVYNNDGTFTYTHDGSETTSDSFTYTIDDGAGGTSTATVNLTVNPVIDPPVANDFDGDSKSDILWQSSSGRAEAWLMDGTNATFVSAAGPFNPGPSWHVKGSGDFNGDGKADIIWQGDSGAAAMWLMDGTNTTFVGAVGPFNPGPSWHIKGTGDFDGDGKSDILWQGDNGTAAMWLMDGTNATFVGAVGPFNPGPTWHIKATGDFDGDGKSDILWQGDNGTAAMWLMDGTNATFAGAVGPFNPGPSWQIKGTGDFDGDGKSDILWQGQDGTPAIWLMDGTNTTFVGAVGPFNPGPSWDIKGTGDFNGDGKSDILWQGQNGTPAIWMMDGTDVLSVGAAGSFNPGSDWHVII